jgi:uncharacterized Zn finger protein
MSRETLDEKAGRLLSTGSVRVLELDGRGYGRARVDGDHGRYDVALDGNGRPRCSCPAYGRCSHAQAVALVVPRVPVSVTGAGV